MKTQITPGDWSWQGTRGNPKAYAYLSNAEGDQVLGGLPDVSISPADAKAIAALPKLIAALQGFTVGWDGGATISVSAKAFKNARTTLAAAGVE
jgi:hypothetical protein